MDALSGEAMRPDARVTSAAPRINELDRVFGAVRRHRWLFIAVAFAVFALVAFVTLRSSPRYTASATVLIHEHTPDVLHLNAITPEDAASQAVSADSSAVDTQVEILKSRALAAGVVDQLHLDRDPEFNGALSPPGRLARLLARLSGRSAAPTEDPALTKQRESEGVISAVMNDLEVKRTGLTYTINLSFTAFEPAKAAMIANAFTQRYLTEGVDTTIDQTSTAMSWMDGRLAQLRQESQSADAAVEQYKISNNLLSGVGSTLTQQEISNLDTQLAQARAEDAEQDARLKTAQSQVAAGSNGSDVGAAMNNPVIQSLRGQQAQASAQLADLQARYGDKHPDVIKAKHALAEIDAQIQTQIQRVLSSLSAESVVAHTRTASLTASAGQARAALAGNNRDLVRLNQLQSDADAAKAIYDAFLVRYKETIAKQGVQAPDARVVTQAKLPTGPRSPNKRLDLAIAAVLGMVAGVIAIGAAELFRRGVSSPAEVEQAFDLPELGELPTLASTLDGKLRGLRRLNPVDYVAAKPLSLFAEAFRNLRAALVSSRTGVNVKVIAITSALPGEGKTTAAICLARTMALSGARVVLVDCDLRQRSINSLLPAEPTVGLLEVLNGTANLTQALVKDSKTDMLILPLAKSAFTPRDVFGSLAMDRLLEELRARYDCVVLDTAPVLAVADTRVLCPKTDAVLLLVKWRRTPRKAVLAALRVMNPEDTFIAGVALTQVNLREQARAGEGEAQYYRAYKKYYQT
jgi:polysaccharide biosynthesis transport protein